MKNISTPDISELKSEKHNLKSYFEKINIEKIPNKDSYLLSIYWKSDRYSLNYDKCFFEKGGKQLAICVDVEKSDDEFYKGTNKPLKEIINIPGAIESIVLDETRSTWKFTPPMVNSEWEDSDDNGMYPYFSYR